MRNSLNYVERNSFGPMDETRPEKSQQISGWILGIRYKIVVCGTVKTIIPSRLYNEAYRSLRRGMIIEEGDMSRRSRVIHLALLIGSLHFAWFSLQQLRAISSFNISKLWLIGAPMFGFAFIITKARQLPMAMDTSLPQSSLADFCAPSRPGDRNQLMLWTGILLGVCAILIAPYPAFQPWLVLIIWIAGIVLLLLGTTSREKMSGFLAQAATSVRESRWELLLVLALTILAFLLRGFALEAIPHNVHGDEGEMGLVARAIMRGEVRDLFSTAWATHSVLWFFIQSLSLRIFGDNIGGLRMLSALFGTLAIPALYFLARSLYGRAAAIIAAALLAVYHFHVHYSRIGLENIVDPTMMILTLIAFFYGYNQRSRLGFALAGVIMGLAQYFYFSARLIPLVILVLLGYLALRDRQGLLEIRRQIGIMAVGFILSVGPLLRYYLSHPGVFSARLFEHGLLQNHNYVKLQVGGHSMFSALIEHAYHAFGLLIAVPEDSPFYNAGVPLLDHGMDVLFILSLVLLLLNWRKIEYIVLLLWVGGTALFGGFLLWDFPQSERYIIAAPALCILMSLALAQIYLLLSQMGRLLHWLGMALITVAVFAIMIWNIFFYFGDYTWHNNYGATDAVTEIANYLHPQAGSRYVYMFASPYFYLGYGTIKFVGQDPAGIDIIDPLASAAALPDPTPGLKPLFIFVPERLSELEIVKQRYPKGQLQEYCFQPLNIRPSIYIYEPGN